MTTTCSLTERISTQADCIQWPATSQRVRGRICGILFGDEKSHQASNQKQSNAPSMPNADMSYQVSNVGAELRNTTLALAWKAADIYATDPASVDAVAEAGQLVSLTLPASDVRLLVAVVNDAACHLANTRVVGTARPADPTRWVNWQASAVELWPILADAACFAYRHPIPAGQHPGRYETTTPGSR